MGSKAQASPRLMTTSKTKINRIHWQALANLSHPEYFHGTIILMIGYCYEKKKIGDLKNNSKDDDGVGDFHDPLNAMFQY